VTDIEAGRGRIPAWLLALCVFGSGFTGLVYELVWTRRLELTFGSTTYSITAVLAAFMAGLGLGSSFLGRRADRFRPGGLRLYAFLELGIGVYACVSLRLLDGVEHLYVALQRWLELGPAAGAWLKLVLTFPVLMLPAGLMGGTLPVLVRAVVESRERANAAVSWLYGVNTIGAAAGTLLTGLVLVERAGLSASTWGACMVNIGIALLMLIWTRPDARRPAAPATAPAQDLRLRDHLRRWPVLYCALAATLTGFLSMLYEIVWTRLLTQLVGGCAYTFSIVLGIFLLGLSLGALLYAWRARRAPPQPATPAVLLLLLAAWALCTLWMLPGLPRLIMWLSHLPGPIWTHLVFFEVVLALFVLALPTLLLGALLPLSIGLVARDLGRLGGDVGGVYLANTGGAIAGSVLTGFVLVPTLGTRLTLLLGVLLNLALAAAGLGSLLRTPRRRLAGAGMAGVLLLLALVLPRWPGHLLDSGAGFLFQPAANASRLELDMLATVSPSRLLFLAEGTNATISVRLHAGELRMRINGKPDATSDPVDMPTQVVTGALGLLLHPRPAQVAIVGQGSGVTAHVATLFPEVEHVDIVELERAVLDGSRLFSELNGNVLDHPKVQAHADDARTYFLSTRRRYDVILSEPSNPWLVGSALFSLEHYRAAARRLTPGGLYVQWIQLYNIDAASLALVMRTMLHVFPHLQAWATSDLDLLLVGSEREPVFSRARVERAFAASPRLALLMEAWGTGASAEAASGAFLLSRRSLEWLCARQGNELLSDDRPTLEYRALRRLGQSMHEPLLALLRTRNITGDHDPPSDGPLPAPGVRMAGLVRLLRTDPRIALTVAEWAHSTLGPAAELSLVRARLQVDVNRGQASDDEARRLLASLPATMSRAARAEADLLEAELLRRAGQPEAALERLARLGEQRPVARRDLALRALLQLGRHEQAWQVAEQLAPLLATEDADALTLPRSAMLQTFETLFEASREWPRAMRLLRQLTGGRHGYRMHPGGLLLLATTAFNASQPQEARRAMDEVRRFGVLPLAWYQICARVYRAAGAPVQARECQEAFEHYSEPVDSLLPGNGL
jgi:spermidine synthase